MAETDDWWTYPNGRVHYTKLRNHLKELVDEIIEDAIDKGVVTTRKKPGPKYVSGLTLLDPIVCSHDPAYAAKPQRCRWSDYTHWYCPGCAAMDESMPGRRVASTAWRRDITAPGATTESVRTHAPMTPRPRAHAAIMLPKRNIITSHFTSVLYAT
jgi:hypothetical protein|eukprot:517-Prymnesium_polylepis.1